MLRYGILMLMMTGLSVVVADLKADSIPPGSAIFGPGECPPIVVGRTTYNNGICDGLMCKYEVRVAGSMIGATYTRIQNNCFN
ncbi:hypothetical protein DdX_02673 [Ditylenchus destructor]|uniref:Uncharacterized protein n=1 Tax=Ditylenchus destructor TaxID=166010 RepID=A0AAD4NGL5_9BILA|nr:hypothetical protein DdX_02673 [Ditylenchus destructor]